LAGIVAIAFATYFLLKLKQPFFTGMAYPLIAVALIQIVVGSSIYLRSPKDIVRVNEIAQTHSTKIQSEEIPRMHVVMKNFTIYHWVEIILLLAGIIMLLFFSPFTILKGVALGVAIQASNMLLLDFFAESRAKSYLEYLQTML
jgi:hypothetical protein